ncbi:DEGP3, partial [Symbiodinium sp. CCMP2456]
MGVQARHSIWLQNIQSISPVSVPAEEAEVPAEDTEFKELVPEVEPDAMDSHKVGAAVVKIFVTRQRPAMVVPWQTQQVESTSGSGTFIMRRRGLVNHLSGLLEEPDPLEPPYLHFTDVEQAVEDFEGDLVLTAAHVIADARDIRVQLLASPGASPDKFVARVVAVAHDCDLALLEVVDSRCFEGATPMPLMKPQEMLPMQARVQVMGFPIGGDYLSITEGVLSRIEVVDYSHSRRSCLAMTVDAAIN